MRKLWYVARYEFERHAFTRGYVFILLAVPVFVMLLVGLGYLSTLTQYDYTPVGYVDHAGLLGENPLLPPLRAGSGARETVPMLAFPTEAAARQALDAGQIQAYYIVPEAYPLIDAVDLVYYQYPSDNATAQFWDFLQINLLRDQPREVAARAVAGTQLVARTPDGSREVTENQELTQFLPVFAGIAFLILFVISSGYLMEAVAKEKENRTMEVLITSVAPGQIIGGKLLGILALTFVQAAVWVGLSALAISFGGQVLGMQSLQNVGVAPGTLITLLALLVPTFVMLAALMIGLGSTIVDPQEANAVGPLLLMVFEIPYIMVALFIETPNSTLAVGLSLFPLSSLQAMSLRLAITTVPTWQILASIGFLWLCAGAAIWLAGRAFRLGMLRYGQRLHWRLLLGQSPVTAPAAAAAPTEKGR